VRWPRE